MNTILKTIALLIVTILIGILKGNSQDIFSAIEQGDAATVKKCLQAEPQLLNQKNADAETPLNFAAKKGQAEIARVLLDMGADPLLGDRENSMPVHLAAIGGSTETIDVFLNQGIAIDSRDNNGMTPLHFALLMRQPAMAQYLIAKGADVNAQNNTGFSPLQYAAIRNDMGTAKMLIARKVDVNDPIDGGMTPVFSAASFGNLDMVKYLVEHGAKLDLETDEGQTMLFFTLNPNTHEVVEYLLKQGLDVKHRDKNRFTPLHDVALRGTATSVARLLLDHGADINAVTADGRTPLTFAAYSRDPDGMSKFLILNGAEVNPDPCKIDKACTCGPNCVKPLHAAAQRGNLPMARNLVSNGANINVYDDNGMTPMHYAVRSGSKDLVSYLVDNGAFLNTPDREQGGTELHLASIMGCEDIAAYLIDRGSNYKMADNNGKTPLDLAWYYNQKDIAYTLLSAGADDQKLKDYVSAPCLLEKPLGPGQAAVWFLGHSGWAVKTQNHFLVFDYFVNPNEPKPGDTCLASGFVCPAEIKDQNVTVFSTHSHPDHFDPRIFSWKNTIPAISYVCCWEPAGVRDSYTLVPVHGQKEVDGMQVYVNHSTDLGGGYLVEVDGLTLFHMGDHANGEDGLMKEFTDEIDMIAAMDKDIDILFGPIRGCSLGQPEQVKKGLYYAMDKLHPALFIPMHSGGHSSEYRKFVDAAHADGISTGMKYFTNKGDRFVYDRNQPGEMVSGL
jgi:ankyrin repeat protein/L-ascorbate metabolism protein UlaG (beta-lactamase superfamily)